MDRFSTDAGVLKKYAISFFKIVSQARFKAPETNQVRTEINEFEINAAHISQERVGASEVAGARSAEVTCECVNLTDIVFFVVFFKMHSQ